MAKSRYAIDHVLGSLNVIAGMLSRWARGYRQYLKPDGPRRQRVMALPFKRPAVSPLERQGDR